MATDLKILLSHYKTGKVDANRALEILKAKSLADGYFYYIGFNKKDGWIEIFKTSESYTDDPAKQLSAEEIDAYLASKSLYIYASPGGWVTIRRIPKGAEDAGHVPTMRSPDENSTM